MNQMENEWNEHKWKKNQINVNFFIIIMLISSIGLMKWNIHDKKKWKALYFGCKTKISSFYSLSLIHCIINIIQNMNNSMKERKKLQKSQQQYLFWFSSSFFFKWRIEFLSLSSSLMMTIRRSKYEILVKIGIFFRSYEHS